MEGEDGVAAPMVDDAVGIKWDTRTLTLIQPNGYYPRIIRLQNRDMLCSFEYDRKIWLRRSKDEGKTWSRRILIAEWDYGILTNAELLQLKNGTLLCFYNERPDSSIKDNTEPFSISITRSEDNGNSWGTPVRLYSTDSNFHNGCWEPAGIQLLSGEVQVYFANEGPYRESDEQEISLLRSNDNGMTWGHPEKICFRPGFRDGMPVPLILQNGKDIVMSIEDNGINGNLIPVIIRTPVEDNWRSGCIGPDSSRRKSALKITLEPMVYAGAPYLRQMPSGRTILSFQQDKSGHLAKAKMVVCIGDEKAENFTRPSMPFAGLTEASQHWNALFVKDSVTVTAVAGTSINGTGGIWSIDGRIYR